MTMIYWNDFFIRNYIFIYCIFTNLYTRIMGMSELKIYFIVDLLPNR